MAGKIRVGVGGWAFEPWRGVFYPAGMPQSRELEFASHVLTSIEINATYYATFKPATWRKWRDATPRDFTFSVKASRYCTSRKDLEEAKSAIDRFLGQGMTELGDKLGPINWQLPATKRFDGEEIEGFLSLLPRMQDGVRLRHALEVRHVSFATPALKALARAHGVAVVHVASDRYPQIDGDASDFTYARVMTSRAQFSAGMTGPELGRIAARARQWSRRGDVFIYFIGGAKIRNPAAAQALIERLRSVKP
ncbi:MAG: DUF72 domain-containing protein [Hyphomicrobiaceae bacterium]|nr:DUF72 domain-containing protein [Hyphomicrobiaceae bacterium]